MGTQKPKNPNAFPSDFTFNDEREIHEGMTLRDYFANSAMQGIMVGDNPASHHPKMVAEWSYQIADAMLKQREP